MVEVPPTHTAPHSRSRSECQRLETENSKLGLVPPKLVLFHLTHMGPLHPVLSTCPCALHTVASMLSVAHVRLHSHRHGCDSIVCSPFEEKMLWRCPLQVCGSVSGSSMSVHCACFSCCCSHLLFYRVPLMSHSTRFGSLKLRSLTCVLVSYVCSGVLRSLPVRVHSPQAIQRCFESFL